MEARKPVISSRDHGHKFTSFNYSDLEIFWRYVENNLKNAQFIFPLKNYTFISRSTLDFESQKFSVIFINTTGNQMHNSDIITVFHTRAQRQIRQHAVHVHIMRLI